MKKIILFFISGICLGLVLFSLIVLITDYISAHEIKLPNKLSLVGFPKFFIILSGSMEPGIKTGSVVLVQKQDNYLLNDTVTYVKDSDKKNPVTHRIVFKDFPNGISNSPTYLIKGDANKTIDNGKFTNENIIGKVLITIPYLGYVADFTKKPQGFIFLIIVPATIIIYEELKNLRKEITKGATKLKYKFNPGITAAGAPIGTQYNKLVVIIPVVGAGLLLVAAAGAFFIDKQNSNNNVFSAATSFGSPIPTPITSPGPTPNTTPIPIAQTLVINEVLPVSDCKAGNDTAQWIEIYNGYPNSQDLKNFKITDGVNIISLVNANDIIIPPGGFALLAHDNSIWHGNPPCYDNHNIITANLGGTLNLNTGHLQLLDNNTPANPIDDVRWGGDTGLNPSINQSIERDPTGHDSVTGDNFLATDFVIRSNPTPGM